ncbi:MAG TPA: protein-disulfide reductase DsbD N-terminal domain-containing protein [Casimicrobiaceae bacterium]|nr:protein-disulfide reductase DsbD N-terminal domain-containing protein [Casimicrobiaceae bacterium]
MRPIAAAALIGMLAGWPASPVVAQIAAGQPALLPPDQAFRLSARALDPSTLEVRFDIADGYYLYRDRLGFRVAPVPAGPIDLPPGKVKHDAFFGDVQTYRQAVVVRVPLVRAGQAGERLTVNADSQGCADAGVCYPPNPQQVEIVVPAAGARPGDYVEASKPRGWFN